MPVQMQVLSQSRDQRGTVFEPLDAVGLPLQQNVHVVLTEPGGVRGNHYHREGTETLVVLGPALVRLQENGETRDIAVPDGEVQRYIIPPGVPHAIQNTGTTASLVVGFNTHRHDPDRPDTFRTELIPV